MNLARSPFSAPLVSGAARRLRSALAGALAAVLLAVLFAAVPAHATGTATEAAKATPHTVTGRRLALTGDARKAGPLEVFAPPGVRNVTWNGAPLKVKPTASGSLRGTVPGPKDVTLPELTGWKTSAENPEADPDFDDASWTYADKLTTDNPTQPGTLPVLYQDEYGYHYGYVWYRGHFKATGTEKSLSLAANATNPDTSSGAVGQVWLGGTCANFHAALGLDQETYGRSDGPATVTYTVLADGDPVYESGTIDRVTATREMDVDVAGARRPELVVSDAGDGNALDHADWADAKLSCGGGA